MVEIVILLLLIAVFTYIKVENGIVLFLSLLPFHAFIKKTLFFFLTQGSLFSFWKEIVVLIMLSKVVYSRKTVYLLKNLSFGVYIYLVTVISFFLITTNVKLAMNPLRNHIFTILIFLLFSNVYLEIKKPNKLILWPSIAFFISYIMGYVQLFMLKIPLGFLMGRIEFIDTSGYIVYTTTSARILGIERMAGIVGGPNNFGLFVAVSLLLIYIHRFTFLKRYNGKTLNTFLFISFLVGFFTLIYSFSRAGWAIFFGGLVFIFVSLRKKIKWAYFIFPIVIILLMLPFIPEDSPIYEVYDKTFSGKEASAADRLDQVDKGIEEIFKAPWGHGLGTANNQYPDEREFFVESATINMIYEIGFQGYMFLVFIYLIVFFWTFKHGKNNPYSSLSFALIGVTFIASFFSVNTYDMPYVLYSWSIIGLGVNKNLDKKICFANDF